MKTIAAFATLAAFVAQAAAQSTLTINTPANLVVCEPAQLTWTDDGKGPFFLSILPGNQPSASPLKQFPSQTGTSVTWNVDIAAGTSITLALRDQSGQQVFSSAVSIQSGPDSSCVNSNVQEGSGSASGSGAASTTASTGSSSASGSTPTGTTASSASSGASSTPSGLTTSVVGSSSKPTSGASSSTGSSSAGSPSASAGSNTSGAIRGTVSVGAVGFAGLMGLIGATLL